MSEITIRPAAEHETPLILDFIRRLAQYERLEHEMVATEEDLRQTLFGPRPYAEVVFACESKTPLGFALFFHTYSTFMGRPGLYLEDLFVLPEARRRGIGRLLLMWLARTAVERGCARLEWSVLDWNEPSIQFYRNLGAVPMDEWTIFRVAGDALTALAAGNPRGS
jgi:GNAT superfamily N-acetyltransferase